MGYPTNQQCWDLAHSQNWDPITVFAYAAEHAALPPDPGTFLAFEQTVWTWAGNVGIDPVYGFGFIQIHGALPTTREALQGYLNILGVRDPTTGLLSHEQPGSPGGMIRPGPGDGYLGNVQPTDPGIAVRPYTPPGTTVPGQTGIAAATSTGTVVAGASAPPASTSAPSGGLLDRLLGTQTNAASPSADAQLSGTGGSSSTTSTTTTAPKSQLGAVWSTLEKNPVLALAGVGAAYLLLFGVPAHRR